MAANKRRPFSEIAKDLHLVVANPDSSYDDIQALYEESFCGRDPDQVKPGQDWQRTLEEWKDEMLRRYPKKG